MDELGADLVDDMRSWRHQLHRRPELGFDVGRSAELAAHLLRRFGCDEVHTGVGTSGVVGVLRRGGRGPAIGLRADLDALPMQELGAPAYRSELDNAFHGCGHDGHAAMLLGAARHLCDRGRFAGTVVFVFQPDEENGRGAQAMLADGLLERFPVAAMYGLHNLPGMPAGHFATRVGPMMSSEDLFEVTVQGRGGHASTPERHIDPVVVAAEIVLAMQTIVARTVAATEVAVVSVTEVHTDGARNIVPSTVIIKGDCRTFSATVQAGVEARLRQLVAGIAAAHGATATVEYHHEFVPLVNTGAEVAAAVAAATSVAGAAAIDRDGPLITASEDFARYLSAVPGCFMMLGNGLEGACGASLHNPFFDFNDDILAIGAEYWVRLVEQQLPA